MNQRFKILEEDATTLKDDVTTMKEDFTILSEIKNNIAAIVSFFKLLMKVKENEKNEISKVDDEKIINYS